MFTDVVGSVELKNKLGTIEYAARLSEHDAIFRELVRSCHEAEILTDTGDGFFACFASASDAVRTALLFQQRIAAKRGPLRVRIGLHVGEVTRMFGGAGDRSKVVGLAADIASRVMECAQGGQILLTRFPFDEARQFIQAHPPIDDTRVPELCWIAHGEYVFKGSDQPIAVFEVGAVGIAPLSPPTDQASVRRAIRPGDELTLGWRPAGGLELPGQAQWIIREKLGEGGFGEVWLAEHDKTHKRRVLKFCFEPERVRGLKREVVLFRLLTEALGDRRDIARIIDFKFDEAPYFVESEYVAGGSLPEWAARHGGMAGVPLNPRLQIVAQVSTALSAAHSVGVLHKDIKPTNVLMSTETLDAHAILTDFGIGILTDPSQLRKRDITLADLTNTLLSGNESSRTGTRMYAPPESLTNRPFTVQGDVYALGVLL
ncbi:MAG: protein kinase domain-containing protein, partial [Tepidisphaeraceae bacterium]